MKLKIIVAIAALLAVTGSAFAQAPVPPPLAIGSNSASASSFLGGAQAGYNWQRGSFVYGFETDFSVLDLKSEMNTVLSPSPLPLPTAYTDAQVNWYGTVRGRLGWSSGPVLFYGTGGLAYGRVDLESNVSRNPLSLISQTSSVRSGWVAGGGIEYMWRPNVIVNLGYQYVDLGTISVASSTAAFGGALSQSASAHANFSVVTAGLSWRFAPTDTAWGGAYAGGHLGGAWGNSTSANYSSLPVIPPSDVRLKRDITLVGRLDDGLGLYRYRYLWSDTVYVGVMAQEVALIHPEAVVRSALDKYLRVDYDRLGLKLMTLSEWESKGAKL